MSEDSGTFNGSENLEIKCRCPCGSREFQHCVQPPPECLKRRDDSLFPELDLTKGADKRQIRKAQCYMEKSVLVECTREIKQKFLKFRMALNRTLKEVPDIENSLRLLVQPQTGEAADYDGLFLQATKDADFFNFEPLQMIVEECACGNQPAVKLLKDYEEVFRVFAQHRIFSFPEGSLETRPPIQVGKVFLKIKIEEDFRKFLFGRTRHFKAVVKEILNLDGNAQLLMRTVREGCVEITSDMLEKDADKAFAKGLTVQQKRELAKHRISMLECNGKVHYCCCSLFEDQVCYSYKHCWIILPAHQSYSCS